MMTLGVTLAARAQVGVRLPGVTLPALPLGAQRLAPDVTGPAATLLQNVRRLRVQDLVRAHRGALDTDSDGNAIVRGEVLALSPSDSALQRLAAAGFVVSRVLTLDALGERMAVLRGPPGSSTRDALRGARSLDPDGVYDFNHLYLDVGRVAADEAVESDADLQTPATVGKSRTAPPPQRDNAVAGTGASAAHPRLGLVDGGVDVQHPVFKDLVIHQHGCASGPVPSDHGTAVASLMAGRSRDFQGAAPGAELYVADVYCGQPTGGTVDTLAEACSWLVQEGVPVINISLVGPPNRMLERVIRIMIDRGHLVVAAVGNDGPAAPPLYPAAYPDVIGVTGVDGRQRVLVEAERGAQVRFAAPGADMAAAGPASSYAAVRGTSFAAPIVAGLLGSHLQTPSRAEALAALADLTRQAIDLGAPGPDFVYGNGLVGRHVPYVK